MSQIGFSFKSTSDWGSRAMAKAFLRVLVASGPAFTPEWYGKAEPARLAFDPAHLEVPVSLWMQNHGILLKKAKRPRAYWRIQWRHAEQGLFNALSGGMAESHFASEGALAETLRLLRNIYSWGRMVYGSVRHSTDFEAKNVLGGPTRIYSGETVWTSGDNLLWYVPGIYWANFFGPVYVDFFGEDRLRTAPAYHVEELPDGGYLLLTSQSPLDYGREEVRAREDAIMEHLGRDAFFERARPEKPCRVPRFALTQRSAERPLPVVMPDPVAEAIGDPHEFISQAPQLAEALGRRLRARLDCSPASLSRIDDYVLRISRRRDLASDAGRQLLRELAAYYGQTLCLHLGGHWLVQQDSVGGPQPVVVYGSGDAQSLEYPFVAVAKLWQERVRADGLATRWELVSSGAQRRIEQHLRKLTSAAAHGGEGTDTGEKAPRCPPE